MDRRTSRPLTFTSSRPTVCPGGDDDQRIEARRLAQHVAICGLVAELDDEEATRVRGTRRPDARLRPSSAFVDMPPAARRMKRCAQDPAHVSAPTLPATASPIRRRAHGSPGANSIPRMIGTACCARRQHQREHCVLSPISARRSLRRDEKRFHCLAFAQKDASA